MKKHQTISALLPRDLLDRLNALSVERETSRCSVIRQAIREYIRQQDVRKPEQPPMPRQLS